MLFQCSGAVRWRVCARRRSTAPTTEDLLVLAESRRQLRGWHAAMASRGMLLVHPWRLRRRTRLRFASEGSRNEPHTSLEHERSACRIADIHLAKHKTDDGRISTGSHRHHRPRHRHRTARRRQLLGRQCDRHSGGGVGSSGEPQADLQAAQFAIEQLAAIPIDPAFVVHEVQLLRMRALLARAHGDDAGYRSYVERYRTRAAACGYPGSVAIAETM